MMRYIYIFFLTFKVNKWCEYLFKTPQQALQMSTHNMFSLRNKNNVNFQASKSCLDKWILAIYLSLDKS